MKPVKNNEADISLGSRFLLTESKKNVPLKKRALLKAAILVTRYLSNIQLTDTHNGYRVMNRSAASRIQITMDGYEHASEIIDEIARKKISFTEVPVTIDYTEYSREKGQSMFNSVKIFLKMLLKK